MIDNTFIRFYNVVNCCRQPPIPGHGKPQPDSKNANVACEYAGSHK